MSPGWTQTVQCPQRHWLISSRHIALPPTLTPSSLAHASSQVAVLKVSKRWAKPASCKSYAISVTRTTRSQRYCSAECSTVIFGSCSDAAVVISHLALLSPAKRVSSRSGCEVHMVITAFGSSILPIAEVTASSKCRTSVKFDAMDTQNRAPHSGGSSSAAHHT